MTRSAHSPKSSRVSRSLRSGRVVVLALWLTGCHTWQPQRIGPTTRFGNNTRVRVDRTDGNSVMLAAVRIEADSVVGLRPGSWDRAAVAVSDVRSAQALRVSATRTTLAVLGVTGAFVILIGGSLAILVASAGLPAA